MQQSEVEQIFELVRPTLLSKLETVEKPIAVLLGGQGAVGKGQLNKIIKCRYADRRFLEINGDDYRQYHPDYKSLIRNEQTFSTETQIFSNVFTERLIEEGANLHCNIIVEGTMRNPIVPSKTAKYLAEHGFHVLAYVIAAPREFSVISAYSRYVQELRISGHGRLIDIESHDAAVDGLLISVDCLYKSKAVDEIHVYSMFARELIAVFRTQDGDNTLSPSQCIEQARMSQMNDKEQISVMLEDATMLMEYLPHASSKNLEGTIKALQILQQQ